MTDQQPPTPDISAAMDTKLPEELDHQWIKKRMAEAVAAGMQKAQAIGEYHEDEVVDAILALATPKGQKLVFLRPDVFDIFRRQQQILTHPTLGQVIGNPR